MATRGGFAAAADTCMFEVDPKLKAEAGTRAAWLAGR
jgi:hypothetical protein